MNYEKELEKAKTIADIFELAKEVVRDFIGLEQAGLIVGVADLGDHSNGFVGAFYSPHANMIIINKRPLARIVQKNPSLYKYYLFHIVLHEYIHSIGSYDEAATRALVLEISNHYFGADHTVTELSHSMEKLVPLVSFPNAVQEPKDINIEFVSGIDRKNTNYIG